MRRAVVVGAGIGGLGAAIGLRMAGWRVTVLERAERFGHAGAGIGLMVNAITALDRLGVRIGPAPVVVGGVRTMSGRWLARWDPDLLRRVIGSSPMIALHRADLHRALLDALPEDAVRTGVTVRSLADLPDADLVVAADGIDSALRAELWPEVAAPVPTGITTWRGVAPARPGQPEFSQTWGYGSEFGIVPLVDGRVYWFAAVPEPPGRRHDDERAAVAARFAGWHAPIPELIAASDPVLHLDVRHLAEVPRSFVRGRVVLLGDAAHAMTPNLGQGGGQALEDAVVLAAALSADPDVDRALAVYDAGRRPRTAAMARRSAQVGRFLAIRNPVFAAARDLAVRLAPPALGLRATARALSWAPPPIHAPGDHPV